MAARCGKGARSRLRLAVVPLAVLSGLGCAPARAQAVVTAVNGDPITSYDLDQYAKILRVERKPAGRPEALEAAIQDRLKYDEARRWGLDASDSDLSDALQRAAGALKMDTQALSAAVQQAKVDVGVFKYHLRAGSAWDNLVRARNKGVGASDAEIDAELAKGRADKVTNYRLQQVIFVLPVNPSPATVEARIEAAKALRNRFEDCGTGLQLARSLPDVAVKESMSRTSDALSAGLRKVLAETQRGMLTNPERTVNGVEMVAVCDKSDADTGTLRERAQKEVVTEKLRAVSAKMFQDLRATAVVRKD